MNEEEIRATVLRIIQEYAPEVDPAQLKPDVRLRDQVDIDSMDLLNILISVHEEFGVDIPEADYSKLATLNACVAYLKAKLGRPTNLETQPPA